MSRKRPQRQGSLSGLLGEVQELTRQPGGVRDVAVDELRPYTGQPRRVFGEVELEELTRSVREQGILQPLLVRPVTHGTGFEIAAGERRYRAALRAGLETIPVLVRELDDQQMLEVGLVENLQRENLNLLDEIEGVLRLLALRLGITPKDAQQRLMTNLRNPDTADIAAFEQTFALLGRETWQSFAKNKIRVLNWPAEVLEAVRSGGLSYSTAGVVAAAAAEDQAELLDRALAGASRQELKTLLASRQAAGPGTALPEQMSRVSKTLGRARWYQGLTPEQQKELEGWFGKMPAWLRQE